MWKEIIKKYNIRAKKSLGQNFLINEDILEKISSTLDIEWQNIIEVWPWYWALTKKLLEKNPNSLTLIELDREMINILNKRLEDKDLNPYNTSLKIENIDVLKFIPDFTNYYLIANIPYYITSPILRHFLYDIKNSPQKMLILMQEEVWNKILWNKKNKSSVLSLFVAKKCMAEKIVFVWKENFSPAPKVESVVLLFTKHNLYDNINDKDFLEVIKIWLNESRKKLINNLIKEFKKDKILNIFEELKIAENTRGEDLDIETWINLVVLLKKE